MLCNLLDDSECMLGAAGFILANQVHNAQVKGFQDLTDTSDAEVPLKNPPRGQPSQHHRLIGV